ncbi:hypothetical protein C1H46_026163, partial [Malus baccata]
AGHTSPVESVAFNSGEVLVLAGASSGVTKIWDLEETKMVRTLTGHRSSCTAVEFHPFGEFFASGSMDTNLKIWDIRKKGCIHTYKGHTQGISTIKFTPDGRWVVSGGFDNAVKIWDLTAGKLLHDFKFHEGHIRSLDFHPLEFLLATAFVQLVQATHTSLSCILLRNLMKSYNLFKQPIAILVNWCFLKLSQLELVTCSTDRTVKFWDLETFELIGSSRPEPTGVRAIAFHPDGRTLFSGLDDSLKVYSWEPVICHDSVDMGWNRLSDLCIHDGKLLGCSYYRNSVGVWVADISLTKPYAADSTPGHDDCADDKRSVKLPEISGKVESGIRSPGLRCMSPDYDTKEIKNIYVDCSGGKPVASRRMDSPKVVPSSDSKANSAAKQNPSVRLPPKSNEQVVNKSLAVPSIVPRSSPDEKDTANPGGDGVALSRTKRGMLLKPAHARRPSNSKIDFEKLPLDNAVDLNSQTKGVSEDRARESSEEKHSEIKSVEEKFEKVFSPNNPSNLEARNGSLNCSKDTNSVKFVNGVAVVSGRTRSLVERFERRERFDGNEDQATSILSPVISEDQTTCISSPVIPKDQATSVASPVIPEVEASICSPVIPEVEANISRPVIPERDRASTMLKEGPQISGRHMICTNNEGPPEDLMQTHDVFLSTLRSRLTKLQVQADVVTVLLEKMDCLTLDLFSCLLPVLLGLLDSKTERHANISLEMLLKLVAVFGPVIHSTVSGPRPVGVNLQAEQRLECCKQCSIHLQKIQKILPVFVRKDVLCTCNENAAKFLSSKISRVHSEGFIPLFWMQEGWCAGKMCSGIESNYSTVITGSVSPKSAKGWLGSHPVTGDRTYNTALH